LERSSLEFNPKVSDQAKSTAATQPAPSGRCLIGGELSEAQPDLLDRTFRVSIVLKGLDGALEVIGGLLFLFVTPATIDRVVLALTQHELSEDPRDFIAVHALKLAVGLQGTTVFLGALYLLSHGVVKIVLVLALLREKLWAYPWMIAFLGAFIVYQLYRMTFAPSAGLAALTVFDIFVAWLTYREYQRHRARMGGKARALVK
jgi:uncharacterized membrane protein